MQVNFKIVDLIAVEYEDLYLDLHNCYDLVPENLNHQKGDVLQVHFQKENANYIPRNLPEHLYFNFYHCDYINLQEGDPNFENILAGLSYFPSSDRETNDGLIDQPYPNPSDDFIMIFDNDRVIRIHCEEIRLILGAY